MANMDDVVFIKATFIDSAAAAKKATIEEFQKYVKAAAAADFEFLVISELTTGQVTLVGAYTSSKAKEAFLNGKFKELKTTLGMQGVGLDAVVCVLESARSETNPGQKDPARINQELARKPLTYFLLFVDFKVAPDFRRPDGASSGLEDSVKVDTYYGWDKYPQDYPNSNYKQGCAFYFYCSDLNNNKRFLLITAWSDDKALYAFKTTYLPQLTGTWLPRGVTIVPTIETPIPRGDGPPNPRIGTLPGVPPS